MSRKSSYLALGVFAAAMMFLVLVPYFLWHETMDAYFESTEFASGVASARPYAWALAIVLLVGDLFLPVPASAVVAAAGTIYGPLWGGVIGTVGSFLAGLIAYALVRLLGNKARGLLIDRQAMDSLQQFFDTWGVGGIIASRALPVVPEALTFMAGLARMRLNRFIPALLVGAIPTGFLLAWAGSANATSSTLILVLTLVPAGLWCVYLSLLQWLRSRRNRPPNPEHERNP